MFRYSMKVRLDGSVMNEVRRENVSAAEVILLRRLHGRDAVCDVKEIKSDKSEHAEERMTLQTRYAKPLMKLKPAITFEQLFGPEHMPLPNRLQEYERAEAEELNPRQPKSTDRPKTKVDVKTSIDVADLAG